MEKKTRTIGILLLVLLALLITFFGLKKWNTSKSEAEEKKKENAVVHIFETDSLESIEYKEASGEEMSFVKEDDTWEYAPDTTIALTESSMQNMEDAFSDIQAVKEIKKIDPSAKVIMCSAMGQQAMVIEAIQSGARDFIVKPFQPDRVIEAVRKVLG